MDLSLINGAFTSLKLAKDIGLAAMELRDWNKMASEIAKMNTELFKAHDALFGLQRTLFELDGNYRDTARELDKAQEALAERGRYALFEIGLGQFVYRVELPELGRNDGGPAIVEPTHYLCQPCFDAGRKMVLRLYLNAADGPVAVCPHCRDYINAERAG
ncbi:MAG: hypothetical protein PHU46_12100 [Rhodocyclaceae bacterium]|nr:hypothetical protein [Rhodocyclaceae bacterium]